MTTSIDCSAVAAPSYPVDATDVRRTILGMLHRSGASHLGTSMSAVESLIAMYGSVDIEAIRQQRPDRSRILVSKGHGAAATYATMAHYGLLSREDLLTYHRDGSLLAGHVSHAVQGVEHSTGALGHGLSVAVGCALGLRSRGFGDARVFVLMGDGEIQEGSVWEAVMLAHHLRLSNLIAVVDNNGISSITRTNDVLDMAPLAARFAGFGWNTADVDGHDAAALKTAIADLSGRPGPGIVIANTIKGKGVPFAENQPIWHYRSLNDDTYRQALAHLDSLHSREEAQS